MPLRADLETLIACTRWYSRSSGRPQLCVRPEGCPETPVGVACPREPTGWETGMREHRHGAPFVVIRSEDGAGRFQLRLIGELDLGTIDALDAQLAESTDQSPPSSIDVSELRFLDLTGLRALQRAGQADGAPDTRLVGATGVVRRIIELAGMLDPEHVRARGPELQTAGPTLSTRPAPVAREEVKLP
jgi:anti-anti-sigma factor